MGRFQILLDFLYVILYTMKQSTMCYSYLNLESIKTYLSYHKITLRLYSCLNLESTKTARRAHW